MEPQTPLLELQQVSAGYGGDPVITDLNFSAGAGEFIAVLGANGAGKTTTLLTMAGAIRATSGQIRWNGEAVNEPLHCRVRRGLGLVTDDRALFHRLSLIDNLLIGRCDPEFAFDLFPELRPLRKRRVGLLSGGEQQMLTLGRALARHPKLLVIDELSFGLAPQVVVRLLHALRDVVDKHRTSVVVVEQHIAQVLKVADRVYVIQRGRVVMSGTADSIAGRLSDVENAYLSDHFVESSGSSTTVATERNRMRHGTEESRG